MNFLKDPNHLDELMADKGLAYFKANIPAPAVSHHRAWKDAIAREEKKQQQQLDIEKFKRVDREEEALKEARKANQIAEDANLIAESAKRRSTLALGISAATIIVMMAVAILDKSA